jgi:hypothetical protein
MEIENYREQPPNQPVVAIFDIAFSKPRRCVWHEWKLIKSKKGFLFLQEPSFSRVDEFGTRKWFPLIEFSSEDKKEFSNEIIELLKQFLRIP